MTGKDNARLTKVGQRDCSTTLEDVWNKRERQGDENGQLDCALRNGWLSGADQIAMWSDVWTNRASHACGKWQDMLTVWQTTDGHLLIHYWYCFSFVAVCLSANSGIFCSQHCVCACVIVLSRDMLHVCTMSSRSAQTETIKMCCLHSCPGPGKIAIPRPRFFPRFLRFFKRPRFPRFPRVFCTFCCTTRTHSALFGQQRLIVAAFYSNMTSAYTRDL